MLDERGYEIPDNTPVAVPTRLRMPQSRTEQIRSYIRHELSQREFQSGRETFQEADDFDLPDVEWSSPYEETFDPLPEKSAVNTSADVPADKAGKTPVKPETPADEQEEA